MGLVEMIVCDYNTKIYENQINLKCSFLALKSKMNIISLLRA